MPNNTENILRVTGPVDDIERFKVACRGKGANYALADYEKDPKFPREEPIEVCLTFHGTVPVPDEIQAQKYDPAGYEWQSANWSTKWDAYGPPTLMEPRAGVLVYMFTTAWRPPSAWLRATSLKFQSLTFELFARDEYPYCMSIVARWDDGEPRWQECYGESKP